MESWSAHPLFQHHLFRSPEFVQFKERLLSARSTTDGNAFDTSLKNMVPAIAEGFQAISKANAAGDDRIISSVTLLLNKLELKIDSRWDTFTRCLSASLAPIAALLGDGHVANQGPPSPPSCEPSSEPGTQQPSTQPPHRYKGLY
jgi:hypothetical protein